MKKSVNLVIAIVLIGVAANVLSEPTNAETNDNQGGRYRLIIVNQGTYSVPYVIDTQSGRVWRQVPDVQNSMLVFVSMEYKNIDGQLSKVPNETATDVFLKTKSDQDTGKKTGDEPKLDDLEKLKDEYQTLLGDANNQTLSFEEREKRKKSAEDKLKQIRQREKMEDDMKKLFPNANRGGGTNTP